MKRTVLGLFGGCLCSLLGMAQPHPYLSLDNLKGMTQHLCVRRIAQSNDGMMWLGTEGGLYSFDGYHLQRRGTEGDGWLEGLEGLGSVTSLIAAGDSLMVGFARGLCSFSLLSYRFRRLPYAEGENVKGIVRSGDAWWVATDRYIYKNGVRLMAEVDDIFSMNSDGKALYIGTREGVFRYDLGGKRKNWLRVADGLTIVTQLLPDDGRLWVGTARNVVALDGEGNSLFELTMPVTKALCRDGLGNLLVGTDNGLFVVGKDRRVHHLLHDARMSQSLAGDAVWSLFCDRDSNIWMGTNSGLSMVSAGRAKTMYSLPSITGEGAGNQLFCIGCDQKGRLWMGGSNGLLCIWRLGLEGQDYRWYRMNDARYPLPHNRIRVIFTDRQGRLWVGSDGGLLLLNEETEQFERYEITDDQRNWVYDIEEADDKNGGKDGGRLLVTTFDATYTVRPDREANRLVVEQKHPRKSIYRLREEREVICHAWGLRDNYLSAYADSKNGRLLLGGTDGFTVIDTKRLERHAKEATVRITDIVANGTRLTPHQDILSASVTFAPGERVLQFLFSDFDYADELSDNYSYRIGREGDWMPVDAPNKTITLAQLEAGTYELYIRSNGQEATEEQDIEPVLRFTIQAPWYASTLAKVCYALLLAALLYGIFLYVQQRKRLMKAQIERAQLLAQAKLKEKKLLSDNEYLSSQLRLRLIERSGDANDLSGDERFLLDITRVIEENMDDPELNVNFLSEKCGIGGKQLYRRIKAITGMTTVAYIRDQRLKKAASLLAKGGFTVSEVMYMVGFSSASYFTRCFCEEYGVPPSEYKK